MPTNIRTVASGQCSRGSIWNYGKTGPTEAKTRFSAWGSEQTAPHLCGQVCYIAHSDSVPFCDFFHLLDKILVFLAKWLLSGGDWAPKLICSSETGQFCLRAKLSL